MKVLIIGGSGTISTEVVAQALRQGMDVTVLNRGTHPAPAGVKQLIANINDEAEVAEVIKGEFYDCVAQFIAYHPDNMRRDIRLFKDNCKQYIFISSASAYEKPAKSAFINEETPLGNIYWQYSQQKEQCENLLKESGLPYTIVRPSHTYGTKSITVSLHGPSGPSAVVSRMLRGKPVVIAGDGNSLWTITHSRDFAKGFVGLIGNQKAIGEAVGITSDFSYTWNNIHNIIADELGVERNFYHITTDFITATAPKEWDLLGGMAGDKSNSVIFDNSKIKSLVPGFKCTITPEEGLRESVEYIKAHLDDIKPDPAFDDWCDKAIAAHQKAIEEFNIK
jgi:nucleoside-diphosphate-sugar epimerase